MSVDVNIEGASRRRMRRWGRAAAGLVVVALLAAACGSDGDNDKKATGTTSKPGTTSASDAVKVSGQGINDDTIKIGLTIPLSGPSGAFGTNGVAGFDSYLQLANEEGGV